MNKVTPVQFLHCALCGKRLIQRLPNGLFKFAFGMKKDDPNYSPVDMTIQGSVKLVCIKRSCQHINVFHYFPEKEETIPNLNL